MITLDWTLLATGVVFLLTLWALNSLLFRPLFRVMEERAALTTHTRETASEKLNYQKALFQKYSERLKQAKQQSYQLAEAARKEALQERQERVAKAREESEAQVRKAREEIGAEVEVVKRDLREAAEEIAEIISSRVLHQS